MLHMFIAGTILVAVCLVAIGLAVVIARGK